MTQIDMNAWAVIKEIIRRGNDAVVRKKDDGYIVMEDKKTIQYRSSN